MPSDTTATRGDRCGAAIGDGAADTSACRSLAARFAKAFGTIPAPMLPSKTNRQPERAVLFYATEDAAAGTEVEGLIRTTGFEPVRAGGVNVSGRIEVGGELRVGRRLGRPGHQR